MSSKGKALAAVLCIAVIFGCGVYFVRWNMKRRAAAEAPESDPADTHLQQPKVKADPNGFAPVPAADEQQAMTKFKIDSRNDADKWVEDDELVVGVVINGKPRAYVVNTMTGPTREIFNDTLAGIPIAATW